MLKQISSAQNPFAKQIVALQEKSRERKRSGLFVVEGLREIVLALKGGFHARSLVFCPEIYGEIMPRLDTDAEVIEVSETVYHKIAYRGSTEGMLGLFESKSHNLSDLQFDSENPLVLVAEAPEKPGNIGALLRTADAAKLDAVIIANPRTDLYNPNIVRSSVGGIFTNKIAVGSTSEIITYLKDNSIRIYAASLQASVPYNTCDFTGPSAIAVGTEAEGLTREWTDNSDQNIIIPMLGMVDSMNVSVAAGILIFEAKRQRDFS